MNEEDIEIFKIGVAGNSGVGKTSILRYFVGKEFSEEPEDFEDQMIIKKHQEQDLHLVFADTFGQEKFRSLTASYYRAVSVLLYVFSLDDEKSLKDVDNWFQSLKKYSNFSALLVGTKSDLSESRAVDDATVEAFASSHGNMKSFIVSSKSGEGLSDLLEEICGLISEIANKRNSKGKKRCIIC